jgi:5'-nucleotidase
MKRFFALALTVLMAGCVGEQRVVIVSTNDIHSSIENFPRLATLVEELRAEAAGTGNGFGLIDGPAEVLLVDVGDRWTGNPFVDLAPRPLSPIVELQNELGYDLTTFGNHEFDWGQTLLHERMGEMRFPLVCANITSEGSVLGPVAPYATIEAGGIRLAFLGLVTNFTRWNRPEGKAEHFDGLAFPDVYATAEKYATLADEADVFVALSHLGHDVDKTLAARAPALDLILGGHSHTVVDEPVTVGKTLITQAGSRLRYAGITTIARKGRQWLGRHGWSGPVTITNRLVMLDTIPPAPRFETMVRGYLSDPHLLAPIGETAAPFGERGVENMVVDAMRAAVGADLAMYHAGGIRIDTLSGTISTADLYRIEPFQSEVYTLRMTPGQIKGMIINKFNDTNPNESHGPDLIPGGFAYTIVTDEAGEAANVVFDRAERASYLVALPDYVYKNYVFDRTGNAVETGLQVTSILATHLTSPIPLRPDNTPRITISTKTTE